MRWLSAGLLCVPLLAWCLFPAQAQPLPRTVDCTGTTDSTAAYQAAVNAMPDAGTLWHPIGCRILLGTGFASGQCGITVSSRVGVQFISDVRVGNFGGGKTPQFIWNGNGGTVFCVNSTDHPRFIGLAFGVSATGSMDGCIWFDGNPSTHIGTNGVVDYVACNNGSNNNPNFVGISISPTATQNHENYEVSHLYLGCSGSRASVRGRDGVTATGSPNVSSATANFSPADIGRPINISYPGGNVQTTVASVIDAQHAGLAANIPAAVTQATIITGQSYGIGLRNGANQNALQQTFSRISYNNCRTGVYLAGGNGELSHISGGYSDIGIYASSWVAQQVAIDWYEAENDLRGIDSTAPLLRVTNARLSNGNQYADGFFRFGGIVNIQNSYTDFSPPSGAVLIGANPSSNPTITSMTNVWRASWAQLGYALIAMPPPTVINDSMPPENGAPALFQFGCWNQNQSVQTSSACMQVNNTVGHGGGAALQVLSNNQYADWTSSVIGVQVLDMLDVVGSYRAFSAGAATGRVNGQNVPLYMQPLPTVDPHAIGAIWSNQGVLMRSGG